MSMALAAETNERRVSVRLPRPLPWQRKASAIARKPGVRFISACMGRQSGKTTWLSELVGEEALAHRNFQTTWTAPTYDLCAIGQKRFLEYWYPALREFKAGERCAYFWNGSKVLWRTTDNPDASIGLTNDLVVVDEAARVSGDALERALMPTIMVRRGKIIAPSTPRGTKNWFAKWVKTAQSGDHPEYACITGPSTENNTPAVREFVELMRQQLPEHIFRQEFLAEFIDDAGSVFRNIRECMKSTLTGPVPGRIYAIGADLGKHEDFTVLTPIDIVTREVGPQDRFFKISWPMQLERIAAFSRRWNNAIIVLDSTGVGDPIYDQLVTAGLRVVPFRFTSSTKEPLILNLATALENEEILLPEDDGLKVELESYTYEQMPSGAYRYTAPDGMHDDRVISLALALWGVRLCAPGTGASSEEKPQFRGRLTPFSGRRGRIG